MSPAELAVPEAAEIPATPPSEPCGVCGTPLHSDQEWCLECGTGRTILERTPDWRVPVLVVGVIVLLAIAGFVVALVQLGGGSPVRSALTSSSASTAAHTASAPSGSARRASLADWPPGLDGWTVEVAASPTRAAATGAAERLAAGGLSGDIGVLDARQHPAIHPSLDPWKVFDGRYPSRFDAKAAAARLARSGQTGAIVLEVAPPGGI